MSGDLKVRFGEMFRQWAASAATEWGLPAADEGYCAQAYERIPCGVQEWVAKGVEDGIVRPEGHKFTLLGLAQGKGPYDWFSNYKTAGKLVVNWEWFLHVAEYMRLFSLREVPGVRVEFEDDLMDLAIYQDERLLACIETKERADQLRELIDGLKGYERTRDLPDGDRHNDPLRKAKYIAKHNPQYFVGVAAGLRECFRVEYPEGVAFRLVPGFLPPIS